MTEPSPRRKIEIFDRADAPYAYPAGPEGTHV
jgi:hypothetical protein